MRQLKNYLFFTAFLSLGLNQLTADDTDLVAKGGHGGHGGHHGHHGNHHHNGNHNHHHYDHHRGQWDDHHGEWNRNWNGEHGNPGFYSDPANYYQVSPQVVPVTNTEVVPVQTPVNTRVTPNQTPTNYKITQPAVTR